MEAERQRSRREVEMKGQRTENTEGGEKRLIRLYPAGQPDPGCKWDDWMDRP